MRLTVLLSFIVIIFVGFQWVNQNPDSNMFFLLDPDQNWVQVIGFVLLAIMMLLGLLSGTLFNLLRESKSKKIVWKRLLNGFLRNRKTVMALLVAPVIYFSILKLVGNTIEDLTDFLLAFQNGFFWEGVFAAISAETEGGDRLEQR